MILDVYVSLTLIRFSFAGYFDYPFVRCDIYVAVGEYYRLIILLSRVVADLNIAFADIYINRALVRTQFARYIDVAFVNCYIHVAFIGSHRACYTDIAFSDF